MSEPVISELPDEMRELNDRQIWETLQLLELNAKDMAEAVELLNQWSPEAYYYYNTTHAILEDTSNYIKKLQTLIETLKELYTRYRE